MKRAPSFLYRIRPIVGHFERILHRTLPSHSDPRDDYSNHSSIKGAVIPHAEDYLPLGRYRTPFAGQSDFVPSAGSHQQPSSSENTDGVIREKKTKKKKKKKKKKRS